MLDYGQDWLFFFIRIIATVGGAVIGWFVCDPLTRLGYRLTNKGPTPPVLLIIMKAMGAVLLALAIYAWMPLGGGGGLGQGPGKGGLPGKGPGKGGDKTGDKASGDAPKKDDKSTIDPKLDKSTNNGKPIVREIVPIEILGGKRFPNDGKERYYLLKKNESPVGLTDLEDYFKQQHSKLELKIIHTDESAFINTDMDPTRRLQKLASKYDIPSRVHGP